MTFIERPTTWAIVFYAIGLWYLVKGVRGLLGHSIVMATKFSGRKRYSGREARVAGGMALFFAAVFIAVGCVILLSR